MSSAFFLFLMAASAGPSSPVSYDRGREDRERLFVLADRCQDTPCTITENGAIRIAPDVSAHNRVEVLNLHQGSLRTLGLFEESTTFEQKFSERVFSRRPNRRPVNLPRLIEQGKTHTIFMYGLLLQYQLDQGDLLCVRLTSFKDPSHLEDYYFRYHQDALRYDIDVAFIQPINYFYPNPNGVVDAAFSTASLSFSVTKNMDPELQYNFGSKLLRAVKFNLFAGLLVRNEIRPYNANDFVTKSAFDGFVGLGLTAFGFLAVGYGINLVQTPHSTFPFVGLEFVHLMEFLRSLNQDTHSRWKDYLNDEMTSQSP